MAWTPIRYRDFYDIPRAFVVEHQESLFFFDCPFDEQMDDYPERFQVYRLSVEGSEAVERDSWEGLASLGVLIGVIPVNRVKFDDTKRGAVDDSVFATL